MQVPMVEMDGLRLVQNDATAVYIGRKYGLYPTDPKEQYAVNQIYAAAQDARRGFVSYQFEAESEQFLEGDAGKEGHFLLH